MHFELVQIKYVTHHECNSMQHVSVEFKQEAQSCTTDRGSKWTLLFLIIRPGLALFDRHNSQKLLQQYCHTLNDQR